MPSTVYFTDLRADAKRTLLNKINELMDKVDFKGRQRKGGLSAIKLHFGEKGNTSYIRPVYVRSFVDNARKAGAKPFLTDCNTLYVGHRANTVDHLHTAVANGFAYSVVGAPLVIADGLRGKNAVEVAVKTSECETAHIGADIAEADSMICLSHFKGHELTGFGGAIKNLGMGCGARQGKLFMHSNVAPEIKPELCIACGDCLKRCPAGALKLVKREAGEPAPLNSEKPEYKAFNDHDKCIGCGDCILTCLQKAVAIKWDAQMGTVMRRMASYAKAAVMGKQDRSVYFNFLTQISPACDCNSFQDAPLVADLGIAASTDPVAIDQASVDLVNQAPGMPGSCLKHAHEPGGDKFRDIYPNCDWGIQLEYAKEIGLGDREYELIRI